MKRALLPWLYAAVAAVAPARAEPPHIHPLTVSIQRDEVSVDFVLAGALETTIQKRLESGLETTIRYDLLLAERNRYWFDERLESRQFRVTASCDPVRRECTVRDFWNSQPAGVSMARDLPEAARLLISRQAMPAFRVRRDWPHKHLYVSMRASYDAGKFVALAPVDFSTEWKKSKTFKIHDADLR